MTALRELWCRLYHGHLMVKYGESRSTETSSAKAYYMCARCLKVEVLHLIA